MTQARSILGAPPIVEAVVDIDCDVPAPADIDALAAAAAAALVDGYPTARRRLLSEHQLSAVPGQPVAVTSRQGLQALQYASLDEKQIVQFRLNGFSFNRLAPYSSFDDYLPEIERTWRLFVDISRPVLCRVIRLRFINRIALPLTDGRVEIDDYLKLAPRLADEKRLTFVGFFNQHSVEETATGNQANIVFATQPVEQDRLPLIFDIEAFKVGDCEPSDWNTISGRIASLRALKNLVFRNSLSDTCLNLFQP